MIAALLASRYRQIAQFHENEHLIAWLGAQRWVVWLTPERRKFVLVVGAVCAGLVGTFHRSNVERIASVATAWLVCGLAFLILLAIVYSLYRVAVHYKRLPSIIRGSPQICFHLLFWLLLLAIWSAPENSGLGWLVVSVVALSFPYLIWRCGYMLLSGQRGKAAGTGFGDHLFYIWPVWDGTNTPPGKGHDHLSRSVAQTPEAYARAILGGIKLLLLVGLWTFVMQLIGALIYGDPKSPLTPMLHGHGLGLPRLKQIFASEAAFPLPVIWISLYLELIWEALYIAARGHVWIGVLRLYGFNVFRNTYKPLLAESVVEFWNRYYYYFKELMMEFFFLPTYARYFRSHPTLRMIAAVFAAAFIGNMYYHLLQAKEPLVAADWHKLWSLLGARLVYCFLLASGIAISMLRQQSRRGQPASAAVLRSGGVHRLRRMACVWTFFAVINFWNVVANLTIAERSRLFLTLFGL